MPKIKAMKAKKETKKVSKKALKAMTISEKDETETYPHLLEKRTFTRRELSALISDAMFFCLWQTPQERAWDDCVYEGDFITDVIYDRLS